MEEILKFLTKISEYDYGNVGRVHETLSYHQGGLQPILTVPYRGGEGGSKIRKIALRNL